MEKNVPCSATEAALRHGLRSTIHPLNREHFRRERRKQHVYTATLFVKLAGGGFLFAAYVWMIGVLASLCK